MEIILTLISIDIIAAKFLNSYITYHRLKGTEEKRKAVFGRFLERLGFKNDTWPSFFVTVVLVFIATYYLINFYPATSIKILYIATGLFTIFINLGAAHSSYFRKENFVTEKLLQN